MKNKIFLSITMLVSMSSHASQASHASMQEAPLLLMADHFKQAAMEFVFKLAANPEVQEKLKQIFAQIKDDLYDLAETSPNAKALRKDFDVLLDSLKEAALDTIKTHEKELRAISLELVKNLLERSKKDIDKIKEDSKALVVEAVNELKPEFKAVMEELKKLYAAKDKDYPKAGTAKSSVGKLPTAGKNPSSHDGYYLHGNHDGYYLHDGSYHEINKR